MRIRKNRTSSRVTPEFCVSHAEKVENIRLVDAAKIGSPLLQPTIPPRKHPLDVDELELDAAAILNSLDNESSSYKIKIRDFVLSHGGNARSGGSENEICATRPRQSGSESDTGQATSSRKRTAKQLGDGKQPKSASTLSEKINSDTSSKAKGEEIESAQEQTLAKSEVIDDPPPKLTSATAAMTTVVVDSGSSRNVVGSRKRHRRQMESDSGVMQEKEAITKSEDEGRKYPATGAAKATAEKTGPGGKLVVKEERTQLQQVESSTEKVPASSFPAGWSYRGLAQIAEHDKGTQGKQCGRTDGRSWRCPLKVQEGFTLCEHHLSKFRLKKLCKGNKKQKSSPQQCRPQQHQQQQQTTPTSPPSPPPSPPPPQIEISKTTQTPSTLEHDVPMKFRRRHKTVKLSVL